MSRRVFYMDPKGRRLRQEAILAMREARKSLDPGLLEMAREAIAGRAAQHRRRVVKADEPARDDGTVPVDMKKNMAIVLKYLEMQTGNRPLHRQIRNLLSEQ